MVYVTRQPALVKIEHNTQRRAKGQRRLYAPAAERFQHEHEILFYALMQMALPMTGAVSQTAAAAATRRHGVTREVLALFIVSTDCRR